MHFSISSASRGLTASATSRGRDKSRFDLARRDVRARPAVDQPTANRVPILLSVGTDAALRAFGVFPSLDTGTYGPPLLALALVYRSLYAVLGGYVTASLAPVKPMRPVFILGCLGLIGGIGGVIVGLKLPHLWYPIGLAIGAFPLTWWGGRLKANKQ